MNIDEVMKIVGSLYLEVTMLRKQVADLQVSPATETVQTPAVKGRPKPIKGRPRPIE